MADEANRINGIQNKGDTEMTDSLWRWNSIDLWVHDMDVNREIKLAELFGLDETESTWHFFGTGSKHYPIKGLVIGTTNRDSLDSDATANTARTLTTPYESITDLRIRNLKFTAKTYASLTIGGVTYTADTTAIYDFECELVYSP